MVVGGRGVFRGTRHLCLNKDKRADISPFWADSRNFFGLGAAAAAGWEVGGGRIFFFIWLLYYIKCRP